jgi:predicted O-methyltransferase YrrM
VGPSDRQRVRDVIDRLFRERIAIARRDGSVHDLFPVAVTMAEGEALRDCVIQEGASRTIEIGLGYGVSALFMCEGLVVSGRPDARHVVLDPNQESRFANCGLQLLDEAGVGHMVEHRSENSLVALATLLREGRRFDLAFVDGNHRFDGVFVDLVYLGRLLRPAAVVFLDDYQVPAIAKAVSFFASNLGWRLEQVSDADELHQWAILRTAAESDARPFDYFVDF